MAEVHIQDGETLENALPRFKRKVLQEDIEIVLARFDYPSQRIGALPESGRVRRLVGQLEANHLADKSLICL